MILQPCKVRSCRHFAENRCIYKGKLRILKKSLIFIMGKCLEMAPFQDVLDDLKTFQLAELHTVVKS